MARPKSEKNLTLDQKIEQANKRIAVLQKEIDEQKAKIEGYEKEKALTADLERLKSVVVASDVSVDDIIAYIEQKK